MTAENAHNPPAVTAIRYTGEIIIPKLFPEQSPDATPTEILAFYVNAFKLTRTYLDRFKPDNTPGSPTQYVGGVGTIELLATPVNQLTRLAPSLQQVSSRGIEAFNFAHDGLRVAQEAGRHERTFKGLGVKDYVNRFTTQEGLLTSGRINAFGSAEPTSAIVNLSFGTVGTEWQEGLGRPTTRAGGSLAIGHYLLLDNDSKPDAAVLLFNGQGTLESEELVRGLVEPVVKRHTDPYLAAEQFAELAHRIGSPYPADRPIPPVD